MEFCLLGPFEVRRDGRPIDLRGSKRRAVLALLVLHANEVVRAERLIDEIWREQRPANASAALQNHISRLRKDLGADVVVTKPWGYVLRTDPETIDLCRFERLVAEAKPLAAQNRRRLLAEALALWRGPALADLADEQGFAVDCARLDELRLAAIEQRVDADLEVGADDGLIAELEALVAAHPLRERMRGQLILALYRAGRQAEALETYRETRRVLVEELGIEPGSELRELERAILRQDPTLASAAVPDETVDAGNQRRHWRWPRSPVAIGTGLLLVTGAGVAAAVIAARGDRQPSAAYAVATTEASAAGEPTSAQSTTVTAGQAVVATPPPTRPTKVAAETPPAREPRRNRRAGTSQPVGAPVSPAQAPAPRPSRQRPAPASPATTTDTSTSGATTTSPAQPRWLTISDDFPDLVVDPTIWHVIRNGTEVGVTQANGRAEISIGAGAVAGGAYNAIEGHYGTQCRFPSDFDAQVDFTLLEWPEANGVFAGLNAFFADTAVGRQSSSRWGENYAAWVIPNNGSIPGATETSGSLRIARSDGALSAYVMHKGGWLRIATGRNAGVAVIGLQATSTNDDFGHKAVRVAFDNFRVKGRDPTCPYQ